MSSVSALTTLFSFWSQADAQHIIYIMPSRSLLSFSSCRSAAAIAPPPRRLPDSLEASIAEGIIQSHGRLQLLTAQGAVVPDTAHSKIQPEWKAPLERALNYWRELPSQVPSLRLHSVYARGSIPRGLALPGLSDVDTIGFATISDSTSSSSAAALRSWRARSSARAAQLLREFPHATGLEMKLVIAAEDSALGAWLLDATSADDAASSTSSSPSSSSSSASRPFSLTEAQLSELDAFRLASQGLLLDGSDLVAHLPPPLPQPRLMLALRADLARAAQTAADLLIRAGAGIGQDRKGDARAADDALQVARWAAKRSLRSGMELCSRSYGGYSRDLLPSHRAIAATLSETAAKRSLHVLQLSCLPDADVAARGGAAGVALELLEAADRLHEELETTLLEEHFQRPMRSFETSIAEPPPLPDASTSAAAATSSTAATTAAASSAAASSAVRIQQSMAQLALSARVRLSTAATSTAPFGRPFDFLARRSDDEETAALHDDPLPPKTLKSLEYRPAITRVLDLDWRAGHRRERVERVAARAIASARRPVLLRGAAAELAPIGSRVWNLGALPSLVPSGRVRVSPDATFLFCKESHALCASGALPPPSRVCAAMSGEEFVRRIQRPLDELPRSQSAPTTRPLAPLFYGRRERYYMQADLPRTVLREEQVPRLWRSLGAQAQQAQQMRLWVSTSGATTPLHFDACASFLAQMRGEKRIVFFPPRALPGLYAFPVDHPMHRRSRVSLHGCADARDETFPLFSELAEPHAQEIVLREGDCVVFPKHWWHQIETTSPLSCSVGCRYVG